MSDEMETPDTDEEQLSPTAAFTQGSTAKFGKIKLHPYTPIRIVAAQALGIRFGFLDEADAAQLHDRGIYPGAMRDVIHHIWLRSIADEVTLDGVARNPIEATKTAIKFGEKYGLLDTESDSFWAAFEIFLSEMRAIVAARAEPEKKTKPPRGRQKR